ncbi:MAG: hypothetical protein ACYS1A_13835 [Planctomycetota bacterium]
MKSPESRVGRAWRCGGVVCDVGWLIVAGGGGRGRWIFTRRWRVVGNVVVDIGLAGLVR